MKRFTVAKVVKNLGYGEYEDIKVLEKRLNEENPREMFEFWNDKLKCSLKSDELVMVETEYK